MNDENLQLDVYLDKQISNYIASNTQDPIRAESFEQALRLLQDWVPQHPLHCGHIMLADRGPKVYEAEHRNGKLHPVWTSDDHLQLIKEAEQALGVE